MTEHLLSDNAIAALTPDQRRELIQRLARPLTEMLPAPDTLARIRRVRLRLMIFGSIALIPWIVYLAVALPESYTANNWAATWVGFDVLLVVLMATTVVLGWQRRQLLTLTAFATGILLLCDAWFDIMTANPDDRWVSVATAVFAELPLAFVLISGTLRLVRLLAMRQWLLTPGMHLWELRIPV